MEEQPEHRLLDEQGRRSCFVLANQATIILAILLALLAIFAGNMALTLGDFKSDTAHEIAQLRSDLARQTAAYQRDLAEVKERLADINVSTSTSVKQLDAISVYYARASAQLNNTEKR